jgi:hypothetical protein
MASISWTAMRNLPADARMLPWTMYRAPTPLAIPPAAMSPPWNHSVGPSANTENVLNRARPERIVSSTPSKTSAPAKHRNGMTARVGRVRANSGPASIRSRISGPTTRGLSSMRAGKARRSGEQAFLATSATTRNPRRRMVRIRTCFLPSSPIARRAVLMRLLNAASDTMRPFQTRSIISSLLTTRPALSSNRTSRSNTCGSTGTKPPPYRTS